MQKLDWSRTAVKLAGIQFFPKLGQVLHSNVQQRDVENLVGPVAVIALNMLLVVLDK